jgi:hypothetical protein
MTRILIISMMITGLNHCFLEGNILSPMRIWCANHFDRLLGKKWSRYIQKPLWDCLPCMASIWTIVFSCSLNLLLILAVCGVMVVIEKWLDRYNGEEAYHPWFNSNCSVKMEKYNSVFNLIDSFGNVVMYIPMRYVHEFMIEMDRAPSHLRPREYFETLNERELRQNVLLYINNLCLNAVVNRPEMGKVL